VPFKPQSRLLRGDDDQPRANYEVNFSRKSRGDKLALDWGANTVVLGHRVDGCVETRRAERACQLPNEDERT